MVAVAHDSTGMVLGGCSGPQNNSCDSGQNSQKIWLVDKTSSFSQRNPAAISRQIGELREWFAKPAAMESLAAVKRAERQRAPRRARKEASDGT
jgi:hypothetical protein